MTPEQQLALDAARDMARAGIPIFVAPYSASSKTGFNFPMQWEKTQPDPSVVDQWQPGMALCAVMGHGLDLIDIDPRSGGDARMLQGLLPTCYGGANTPSGGYHLFIRSLGVGSRTGFIQGIDFKSGAADGQSRGFAFIAPTVRVSKEDGQAKPYIWFDLPDMKLLLGEGSGDVSGAALAEVLREAKTSSSAKAPIYQGTGRIAEWMNYQEPQSWRSAERAIATKLNQVETFDVQGGIGFRELFMSATLTLGGYVGGGFLDEAEARERLQDAVTEVWPDGPDSDDLLWIDQGLADGAGRPFKVYSQEEEDAWERARRPVTDERHPATAEQLADERPDDAPPPYEWGEWDIQHLLRVDGGFDPREDTTDQGYAHATLVRMYPALRYARDAGMWIQRDAEVWLPSTDSMAKWAISEAAKLMPIGLLPMPKETDARTEEHWQAFRRGLFMSTKGANQIAPKMEALVKGNHLASVKLAKLDDNREILWAGGQAWDLKASVDVPVGAYWIDVNTPHMHTALCAPDPNIPTPRWDAFIEAVLPDPELRAWAMRVLSVSLTGHSSAVLPILYGKERSGKTSLIELLVRILGTYAHAANVKLLGENKDHDTIIYDLKGRRLSFVDEGPKRGHDATERLKQLTGGGSLTARPMNSNPITFRPSHTLVLTTNNEPSMADPALRARMRLIPCDSDESLVQPARKALTEYRLRNEAPGILAKLMKEAAAWLADENTASNAAAPLNVQATAKDITQNQDPVRDWVETFTRPAEPGTPGRVLYTAFAAWHQDHPLFKRMSVTSETLFGRTLSDMGYPPQKLAGRWYRELSVMGGGIGNFAPVNPQGTAINLPDVDAKLNGHGKVTETKGTPTQTGGSGGLNGRVETDPANSDGASSSPVFEGNSGGLAGFTEKVVSNTTHPPYTHIKPHESQGSAPTRQPAVDLQNSGSDQGVIGVAGGGLATRQMPISDENSVYSDEELADVASDLALCVSAGIDLPELPLGYSPLRNLTSYQVTVWSAARGIDKTAGRIELKSIKALAKTHQSRQAKLGKLQAAQGATVQLPAACDRAGHVLELTHDQAVHIVRCCLARTPALTVDVETSGFPIGHEHYKLRTIQLGDDHAAVDFDATDPEQCRLVSGLIYQAEFLQAHSATADLAPLVHANLVDHDSAWLRMHDTALKAKLSDPASTGSDPGLKQLGENMLGSASVAHSADVARAAMFAAGGWLKETEVTTPVERSGWAQTLSGCETMVRYACSDVLETDAIAKRLPPIPDAIMDRERLVQRMTAKLPLVGVRLDYEHIQAMQAKHRPLRAEAAAEVLTMAPSIQNPGSPKQVSEALTGLGIDLRDRKGKISAAKEMLEPLQFHPEVGPLVKQILAYRHNNTVINMFMEPYRILCEKGDGRARPTIYTLGTNTGRMSAVRPNLQQLSRQGGVRACITADPGQLMIGADFSGVELRVAAALSQDQNLMRIIAAGRDIHEEIARQVWGDVPGTDKPRKEDRYVAKRLVFGRLYGGGVAALAAQTGTSPEAAQAVINTLDAMTPGLTQWSANVRNAVKAGQTQFQSYSGRVIYFDRDRPHAAPNYIIQGSARELLVDALVKWRDTRWGDCVLLPVHDELDVFVPEADAELATATLITCMATTFQGVQIAAEPSEPSFAWADSS